MLDAAAAAAKQGMPRPLPDRIAALYFADEPKLEPSDHLFMRAFADLNTCRPVGMGLGPIPWLAIDQYAERHGYNDDPEFGHAFVTIIQEIDNGYRAWHAAHPPKKDGAA